MRLRLAALAFLAAFATVETAPSFAQTPPAASSDQAFVEKARAAIQQYVANNQFSGAVLLAKDGKPILREGFALANRELNVPVTPETIFRLGSITKQFTAASILQLAEQGKLSVDDPVSKYYAAAPAAWSKVTIKHLLTHRSGIPSYTGLPNFFATLAATDRTPEQIIELTRDMPLEFEPGAGYKYDNTGYVILGYIIEKVSGQTYADYVQAHIFKPLGMTHSGYEVTARLPANYAAGYGKDAGEWVKARPLSMTLPYSAGSLYSTVDDLSKWDRALLANKVISKASREAMETNHGDNYGYGVGFKKMGDHASISHSGGINGFATCMNRFTADGVTVVVLANLEVAPSCRIADEVSRLYLGVPAPPPPAALVAVAVKPEVLERYVGVYELQPGFNVTITHVGDGLTAQATGQNALVLTSTSDTEFHFQPAGIRVVFPAGDGPAQSFTLFQGGPREAKRISPKPN